MDGGVLGALAGSLDGDWAWRRGFWPLTPILGDFIAGRLGSDESGGLWVFGSLAANSVGTWPVAGLGSDESGGLVGFWLAGRQFCGDLAAGWIVGWDLEGLRAFGPLTPNSGGTSPLAGLGSDESGGLWVFGSLAANSGGTWLLAGWLDGTWMESGVFAPA